MRSRVSGAAVRGAAVPVAVAAVLSACAGGSPTSTGSAASSSLQAAAAAGTPGAASPAARRAVSLQGELVVRGEAAAGAAVAVRLSAKTPLGSPRVLLVERTVPGWVQVQLPTRPNGSTGWVAASQVRIEAVDDRFTVIPSSTADS